MYPQNATFVIAGEKGTYTNFQPDNKSFSLFSFSQGCGNPISENDLETKVGYVSGPNKSRSKVDTTTTCLNEIKKGTKDINCVITSDDFEDRLYYDSNCGLNAIKDSNRDEIYCPNGYSSVGFVYEYNTASSNNNYKICKRDAPADQLDCCYDKDQSTDINKCEDGYMYGKPNCNIRMEYHCDGTDNNIKDSKYCKTWCNDGNGNDIRGCVDGYKNFCQKPENRTTDFCMGICRKAADTSRDNIYGSKNKELRNMCENSMISYCKSDLKKSFDDNNTDQSKNCRSFCINTTNPDIKAECDTMITNYCATNGPDSKFCGCIKPTTDYSKYSSQLSVHCMDGNCMTYGYKTDIMNKFKCPPCIQVASTMENINSTINLNQKMECNEKGIPIPTTTAPSTPSTPSTPTTPSTNSTNEQNNTNQTGNNNTSTNLNNTGTNNTSTSTDKSTSSQGNIPPNSSTTNYTEKNFWDLSQIDNNILIPVLIFFFFFIVIIVFTIFGQNKKRPYRPMMPMYRPYY